MSIEENKSLVRRYVDRVVNGGDLNALDELVSPNYKRYLSLTAAPLTSDVQKQRLAGFRAAFPDLNLTVEDMIGESDRVAFHGTVRGTHRETFQGIAPTGIEIMVAAWDFVRFENGKIIEHWGGPDLFNLLQQLGAVISKGQQKK